MAGILHRAKEPARIARRKIVAVDYAATMVETAVHLVRTDPVLIFSIGKVGTTALTASIEAATGRPVIKAHGLTSEGLKTRLDREKLITPRPRGIWANQWLRQDLRLRPKHRWQVICGVRDPIALAASAHFYNRRVVGETEPGHPDEADLVDDAAGVADIVEHFSRSEDWFRDELEPITGIDVYAEPFPHDTGYAEYRSGRFHVLLIRQEDIRRVGGDALGGFLGLGGPCPILSRNSGDQDPRYGRFLDEWNAPSRLVDEAYGTRSARHFYSDSERKAMAEKWTT